MPQGAINAILVKRGLYGEEDFTSETAADKDYNLSVADTLMWLADAPNVTQGGQSYSFTDEQRQQFRNRAKALYSEFAKGDTIAPKVIYGYKGSRL